MPNWKRLKMLASAAGGFLDAVDFNRRLVVFGRFARAARGALLGYSSRND
jgi:hypothetical protein